MMKKVYITLALLFMVLTLCGCESKNTEIETIATDMSVYHNLTAEQMSVFKEIEFSSFKNILKNKNTAIVYMGYPDCDNCQKAIVYIADLGIKYDTTIYYLNCLKLVGEDEIYNNALEVMNDVLNTNIETNTKVIQAPEVINIVNGKFKDFEIGYSESKVKEYERFFEEK